MRVPGFQAGSREWAEPEPPPAQRREKGQVSPLSPSSLSSLPFSLFYNLKKPMTDKVREGDMADATHSSEVETKRAS